MSARQAAATLAGRLVRTVDLRRSETQRALPRVQVDLGPGVSALTAHIAVAVLAMLCVALLNPPPLLWAAAAAAAVLMAARPATGAAQLYGASIGVGLAYQPVDLLSLRPFLLLIIVPAMVMLGALTHSLPRYTRVEWAALAPVARRLAIIELGAVSLALAVAVASRRDIEAMPVAVLGAAACAAIAWALRSAIRGTVDEETQRDPDDD